MSQADIVIFRCVKCGYKTGKPLMMCTNCGSIMHPDHEAGFRSSSEQGIWKYHHILPRVKRRITLGEGGTPLLKSRNLAGDSELFLKDEGRNPTGSFRDRAAAMIVSHAVSTGASVLVAATAGNMGVSVAAYSARAGLKAQIMVTRNVDPEKILLMRAFGAKVEVYGDRISSLHEKAVKASRRMGYYDATSVHNPLAYEGMKTISIELVDELGKAPNNVILPLGSGLTLLGVYHGFAELHEAGIIDRVPKLVGVESCSSPLYYELLYGNARTCREKPMPSLSYDSSPIQREVLDIIERHGEVELVDRREALRAAKLLSRREGLFVEPASAVALAGALRSGYTEGSVVLLTGHGLKGPGAYVRGSRLRTPTAVFPSSTKSMILSELHRKPGLTGYEVWKLLGIGITVQAVYQHLRDMEADGLVHSIISEGKRRYFLTNKGRELLVRIK